MNRVAQLKSVAQQDPQFFAKINERLDAAFMQLQNMWAFMDRLSPEKRTSLVEIATEVAKFKQLINTIDKQSQSKDALIAR